MGEPLGCYSMYINALDSISRDPWLQHSNLMNPYLPVSRHDEFEEVQQVSLVPCTMNKTQWIFRQGTFQQWMLLDGIGSWYTLLRPSYIA